MSDLLSDLEGIFRNLYVKNLVFESMQFFTAKVSMLDGFLSILTFKLKLQSNDAFLILKRIFRILINRFILNIF